MVDYKIIKTNIINDIKPFGINLFLILYETHYLPKEVYWIIIDYYIYTHDQMLKLQNDIKTIIFIDVFTLTTISLINKQDLKFDKHGLSPDEWKFILMFASDCLQNSFTQNEIDKSIYNNIPSMSYKLDLYDYINYLKNEYKMGKKLYFHFIDMFKSNILDMLTVDSKYINI
jgi:hypothetical protein